ncbi:MAG: AAA family ATPase [Gammaproteobacteria bacterium]|nr:MAG: AAA family ATPase [Gammaproteobacteria bacterium]
MYFFPDIPSDNTPLEKGIEPRYWYQLNGPFRWFTPVGKVESQDGKPVLKVRVSGPIGLLANSINKTGDLPVPFVLFHGPAGTGKTVFQKLLVRTLLSSERKPVRIPLKHANGKVYQVTIIDHITGEPFLLEPVNAKWAADRYVETAFSHPDHVKVQHIQVHNCATLGKNDLTTILDSMRSTQSMYPRRVFIFSEIDNLIRVQAQALKIFLDNNTMPDGQFILADTNDIETTRSHMAEAIERAQVFFVPAWSQEDLRAAVTYYSNALSITYDENSFQQFNTTPAEFIAAHARGAIRVVLKTLQHLRFHKDTVTAGALIDLMNVQTFGSVVGIQKSYKFLTAVYQKRFSSPQEIFVWISNNLVNSSISIDTFIEDLAYYFRLYVNDATIKPVVNNPEFYKIMEEIYSLRRPEGNPMNNMRFALLAKYLFDLNQLIRSTIGS